MKKVLIFLSITFTLVFMSACSFSCSGNNQNLDEQYYLEHSTIMTLNEAYDSGYLNENDLMHISYYLNGVVYKISLEEDDVYDSSKWIKVDFCPELAVPIISSDVESDIKSAYYYRYLQDFQDENGSLKYSKDIIEIDYLGCYNNFYVARVDSKYWNYGDIVQNVRVGDIIWQQSSPLVKVFTFNK